MTTKTLIKQIYQRRRTVLDRKRLAFDALNVYLQLEVLKKVVKSHLYVRKYEFVNLQAVNYT